MLSDSDLPAAVWHNYPGALHESGYIDANLAAIIGIYTKLAHESKSQLCMKSFVPPRVSESMQTPRHFKTPYRTGLKSSVRKLFSAPGGSGVAVFYL